MIKMIGLDLDGTFLDSAKEIPQENIDAVSTALARGITVLPVTGRPFRAIPEEILTCVPFRYCIASGGAMIYDLSVGSLIEAHLIPAELAREVTELLLKEGFLLNIFTEGTGYVNEQDFETVIAYAPTEASRRYMRTFRIPVPDITALIAEHPEGIEKLTVASPRDENGVFARADELNRLLAPYGMLLNIMSNTEIMIEIQSAEAAKGKAMLSLGRRLGIGQEETMAFGDSENDLEMIETVRLGVAMGNSYDGLKKAAQLIAPDNDHAGVARVIRKYALGADQC